MSKRAKAVVWIGVYLVLVLAPLILIIATPRPPQRGFWREFAVALGFTGLSLMGLQFVPTARLGFLASVFPMDTLYHFHHWTSVASTVLILAHPVLLIANNPNTLILFDFANAPWRARAAIVAGVCVILLTGLSVWRRDLAIKYEPWRILHNVLALAATGLALWHIFGVRYYLASPFQRSLWIALPAVWAGLIGYVRVYKPWMMTRRPYELAQLRAERGNCWTLALEPVGHAGLTFKAGQFAWLTIGRSPFRIREHPFSFSSSAERPVPLEFTAKELGDFTSRLGSLPSGTAVYLDGPYGEFSIAGREAPGYVFLAGGIGSAPMMSMLRTLADRGDDRTLLFFYGSKRWDEITFREELEVLQERLDLQVVHVLEEPPAEWDGETGYMSAELLDRYLPARRDSLVYFVSGPVPMIRAVEKILRGLDIPPRQVSEERYEMA